MAHILKYLGGMKLDKSKRYSTDEILLKYQTANIIQFKTDKALVSVSDSDMFEINFDDISYIESGQHYIFNKDVTVAICTLIGA